MSQPFTESSFAKPDVTFDFSLRPKSLDTFLGQEALKERLMISLQAHKERGEALGHCLFHGPPGLGKTTLAHIIAESMGTQIVITSGPALERAGDLVGLLTKLNEGDILFIDEIHRMGKAIEEYLYPAMEDFALDIMIDSGPSSRSVKVELKKFTLVGATTRIGLLSSPMRSRFASTLRLNYYEPAILATILYRSAKLLNVTLAAEAALEIANRSRGTPRIANHLLRWVRDYAQIQKAPTIDLPITLPALEMLSIDPKGLDEMDISLLETIIDHHDGGPVGLNTLSAALNEEANTLSEVYEPYLVMRGFLRLTKRGREATPLAYTHLKRSPS